MEQERITIATSNAQRGRMIRTSGGLAPFWNTDVLLLSEVYPKRDNLKERLDAAGFELVATDNLDLAIAIRKNKGIQFVSSQQYSLSKDTLVRRFFKSLGIRKFRVSNERNMLLAKLRTAQGEEFNVATLHPATPYRPFARAAQMRAMGEIVQRLGGNLIIGADFNHFPSPRQVDINAREAAGLRPVSMGRMRTFTRGFGGQLDDMLYKGPGIKDLGTRVVDVRSDHKALFTTFELATTSRALQQPRREQFALAA